MNRNNRGRVDGMYRGVMGRQPSFAEVAETKLMRGNSAYQQLDNGDELSVVWKDGKFILTNHSHGVIEEYNSVKEINKEYDISLQVN